MTKYKCECGKEYTVFGFDFCHFGDMNVPPQIAEMECMSFIDSVINLKDIIKSNQHQLASKELYMQGTEVTPFLSGSSLVFERTEKFFDNVQCDFLDTFFTDYNKKVESNHKEVITISRYQVDKIYPLFNLDTHYTYPDNSGKVTNIPWYEDRHDITEVVFDTLVEPVSTAFWFFDMLNLNNIIELENLDTSMSDNMTLMFYNCKSLKSDVIGTLDFNTSNVTSMAGMFNSCYNLTSLNLDSFDTQNVHDMSAMFAYCSNLKSLSMKFAKTDSLDKDYGTQDMFVGCSKLSGIETNNKDIADAYVEAEREHRLSF